MASLHGLFVFQTGGRVETQAKARRSENGNPPRWAGLALGAVLLGACVSERADPLQPSEAAGAPAPVQADSSSGQRFEGWLSIVWNDEPHYFLTDDGGQTVELLLDEELTAPLGGPLALDRSRVIVLAVVTQAEPDLYEAISIAPAGEG